MRSFACSRNLGAKRYNIVYMIIFFRRRHGLPAHHMSELPVALNVTRCKENGAPGYQTKRTPRSRTPSITTAVVLEGDMGRRAGGRASVRSRKLREGCWLGMTSGVHDVILCFPKGIFSALTCFILIKMGGGETDQVERYRKSRRREETRPSVATCALCASSSPYVLRACFG